MPWASSDGWSKAAMVLVAGTKAIRHNRPRAGPAALARSVTALLRAFGSGFCPRPSLPLRHAVEKMRFLWHLIVDRLSLDCVFVLRVCIVIRVYSNGEATTAEMYPVSWCCHGFCVFVF